MKIPQGSSVKLSTVAEDLFIGDRSAIECTGEGNSLKVEGDVKCEGRVEFTGNVSCANFRGADCRVRTMSLACQSLSIKDGSLEVAGDLLARSIDVDKKLVVTGKTEGYDIEVGGILELASVKARSIRVGGKFHASADVEADDIDVGGLVEILGKINSKSVDVGGKVKLNGGNITDRIEVGGVFESTQELNFGDLDVGGVIVLAGHSRGKDIEVGGKLQVRGDIAFRRLEVGGTASVEGSAEGERIDLGGRLRIDSDLKLSDTLDVGGTVEVGGTAEARNVDIGGSFKSRSLKVETADLRGHVRTERGIFAIRRIRVERKSRVEGWIKSLESVSVDSHGEVESVSAPRVSLGDRSRAVNVYADVLELEDRAEISGEALYTQSVSNRSLEGVGDRSGVHARKVDSIPNEKRWALNSQPAHA